MSRTCRLGDCAAAGKCGGALGTATRILRAVFRRVHREATTGNRTTATTMMTVAIAATITVNTTHSATTTATSSATATATTITITITATDTIAAVDFVTRIQLFYQGQNPGWGAR